MKRFAPPAGPEPPHKRARLDSNAPANNQSSGSSPTIKAEPVASPVLAPVVTVKDEAAASNSGSQTTASQAATQAPRAHSQAANQVTARSQPQPSNPVNALPAAVPTCEPHTPFRFQFQPAGPGNGHTPAAPHNDLSRRPEVIAGGARQPSVQLLTAVSGLSNRQLNELLVRHASANGTLAAEVTRLYEERIRLEERAVEGFQTLSNNLWNELRVTYSNMSNRRQAAASFRVVQDICSAINTIRQATLPGTMFRTRCHGLFALRKIGWNIVLAGGGKLVRQVIWQLRNDVQLTDTIWEIICNMTEEEREQMRACDCGEGRFDDKMDELAEMAEEHGLFAEMDDCIDLLWNQPEEDDDGNDGDDDDGYWEDGNSWGYEYGRGNTYNFYNYS
ncbi:uncharacterized protein K452DRAFT_359522 [Aplosporella prunicola CBS 121167]|uniref:Uncharacterized protein n=1 Tax=Aplosporella prunicola CBS 121167 TaxID=1176127 RepID=A0A6A6B8F9_9PEZI|nr:uncharacterized protein K452DRAFT_359522 [Aplosporella prunicola CBS 121167]KAF2140439.1 hypothetical protein K452DRAFT_359522 [Aplosporella prunicola CBS 121167]